MAGQSHSYSPLLREHRAPVRSHFFSAFFSSCVAFMLVILVVVRRPAQPLGRDPEVESGLGQQLEAAERNACSEGPAVRWMWADASIIGHWAAEMDPFRWSAWESHDDAAKELETYKGQDRPVEVEIGSQRNSWDIITRRYPSIEAAIDHLGVRQEELTRQSASNSKAHTASRSMFDPNVSRSLALMSQATYCAEATALSSWTCDGCRNSGLTIQPGSLRQFFGDQQRLYGFTVQLQGPLPFADTCLLAIRGTANTNNLWIDLDEWQEKLPGSWQCPGCYVHAGFLKDWAALEHPILSSLNASGCERKRVYITGHSLGGALATLGAWALQLRYGFKLAAIYTYESPRVGTTEFVNAWDTVIAKALPAFRVTFEDDPVTLIPCFWGHFLHVQHEIRYAADGSFRIIPGRECPCDETEITGSILVTSLSRRCA
eukprot:TRINITY_DN38312_c0_g1_i1.p1 TRINITY_DN38312_c0_g1~~TRINITY_DN38312_c0_g1_i1.p1  ORF type:complete len:431 (-),score=56.97 TRINITY_DN38312_c0_g1_i1:32-1324(-)